MLKRSPSLVEQVKTHLKERIVNLEFDGGRMPSESNLADELKVSRNTIRDALSRLEMEGIIFRKQGAGTFVNEAILLVKTRLDEIIPYEQLIQEHSYIPSVKLTYVKEETVDPQIAAQLKSNNDEKMLTVQKLFCADEKPVILTHSYIPTSLITKPYHQDEFLKPTYHFLSNFCRQTLAYFLTDIVPLIAPAWLVDQLGLPQPQTALLSFQEMGFNQENVPIIKATSYFRDELLRLRLMRRPMN